ncbi:Extracellular ribonuclease LE [Apostasia shenzhenica]|uniref:Extracellular ribonuclease LE n=1 Tax=Apostasia shenzhenica TaxID=1088818 RepID=A0A2I0B466_9ASPA|nr:Extracellular ribonuclease LE [Apostasia shenzhenica]
MGSRAAFVFLLGLMLLASLCLAAKGFDFYYFILLWPGAYCQATNSGCCRPTTGKPADDFLIRDLVTFNITTGSAVTGCEKINFNFTELSSIRSELEAHWANIKCPSNDGKSNWRSKWKNYGVCSGLNETEYFKRGLELKAKVDLLSHLSSKGIYPNYNLYKIRDIKNAIAAGIGTEPLIRCSKGPFGTFQLFEVHICVARDGWTIIDCPVKPKFTCNDEILFHPYKSWMLNDTAKAFSVIPRIEMPISME